MQQTTILLHGYYNHSGCKIRISQRVPLQDHREKMEDWGPSTPQVQITDIFSKTTSKVLTSMEGDSKISCHHLSQIKLKFMKFISVKALTPCYSPMRQIVICEYELYKYNLIDWLIDI